MLILLTGGSACGKSTYAEELATRLPIKRYYIAAMRPYGEESLKKIARHRQMRSLKSFETIEKYTHVSEIDIPEKNSVILLECLCNLTANEMFDEDGSGADGAFDAVISGIKKLMASCDTLIVVTNDVGSDGGSYDAATLEYVKLLGKINEKTAKLADTVIEMVCGIPLIIKGDI